MISSSFLIFALGALQAMAAPAYGRVSKQAPTVHFCGDSTMAKGGSNSGKTDGWGNYIGNYLTTTVSNHAIGGRSARSYWDEGRFQAVADTVQSGDIVVIEFGHNDGGSPEKNDNGRSDCPGDGTETCTSDSTGKTVYTFVYYVTQAAKLMTAKGASVILSSQTPNNQWETGSFEGGASRFVAYTKTAVTALNDASVTYVDHFQAVSNMYEKLGATAVNAFYPSDHTHTSPDGADAAAKAFVQAIYQSLNGETSLKSYVKEPVTLVY
ncbi:unnamed protein product [Clonostachys rosea f. rosea IK726]|jgi:rhamnogalacturonan acetylesterase|uniref:Uncharacterized protein n=2 Tax=Bionectria ochroleuca TaxID=29856 RepID=A0A0B7KE62_BIOOC|nr:unnamed protein product [Clonostachys rosea f. rosea IK726]